jgi:NAD(P)-dependent dehydrogenase (short-subunit alcohol dehydrogenase family)
VSDPTNGTLQGKVAIVTGAGRGIGRGIATELAAEGASVVVASRTASTVEEVVGKIVADGGTAVGVTCDISQADQIVGMVDRAVEAFGTVDILVNNAQSFGTAQEPTGSPANIPIERLPEEAWDWMFETGVKATLRAMQAVLPHMKEGGGRIINLGSRLGFTADPGYAHYAANKESVRALSRVAAREWGQYGITVNVINPILATEASQEFRANNPGAAERALANTPMGRFGTPAEGGRLAVFLAGPDASFLTGMTFFLDGGQTILP